MTRKRTIVPLAIAFGALALAAYAIAARQTTTVASYTGCLKNGKIESVAVGDSPTAPCGAGQTQVRLSGGDITSVHVRTGVGLVGGGNSGDVDLGINATVIQDRVTGSCLGNPIFPVDASISAIHEDGTVSCNHDDVGTSTDGFAGFSDGPVALPSSYPPPPIAQLALPAGKYAITATLDVDSLSNADSLVTVNCALHAGADFDETSVLLPATLSPGIQSRLVLSVVHEFDNPSRALIDCDGISAKPNGGTGEWRFLKITATRVANLSNGPLTLLPLQDTEMKRPVITAATSTPTPREVSK